MEMKIMLSAIIAFLMIGAPSIFAISDYQYGFNHGVSDARDSRQLPDGCHCIYFSRVTASRIVLVTDTNSLES